MPNEKKNGPIRFANEVSAGFSTDRVDREAGVIFGVSVMSRGDARGKQLWIDSTLINQLAQFGQNAGDRGIEAHLTHEHFETGEGVYSLLGRMPNFSVEGDGEKVKADLSFVKSASSSPKGDLAKFAMDIADDASDLVGMSVISQPDEVEMLKFIKENGGIAFKSTDEDNKNNFPHFRARDLRSVDLTDSPSANDGGLFDAKNSSGREKLAVILYGEEVQTMDSQETQAAVEEEAVENSPVAPETEEAVEFQEEPEANPVIVQSDVDKAVEDGLRADHARCFAIREKAKAIGQEALGEKFALDFTPLDIALSAMTEVAFSELKAARVSVGANAEANYVSKKESLNDSEAKGREVRTKDVEKFMTENPKATHIEAMIAVSTQFAKGQVI